MGLFGLLCAGNIGNDASMEVVLRYLRTHRPDAILDAMCPGPERLTAEYGIEAIPLHWHHKYEKQGWQGKARQGTAWRGVARQASTAGVLATLRKSLGLGLGLGIDAFRTAAWVRRHDVLIVPGAGVLETSVRMRPWEDPYTMFLLCASGWLFRKKVALVSVGANVMNQRLTRWLFTTAARLAFYRSYRDTLSRDAMRQQGIDTTRDHVYSDLVFGLPSPAYESGDPQTVGVGVMAYHGTNDDRRQADQLYADYVTAMKQFLQWLLDNGRKIRLFVGDTNGSDGSVVAEIMAELQARRPDLDPTQVVAEPVASWAELMRSMAPAGTFVAARYHNVLCALMLSRPVISISYAEKHDVLMADMGLPGFCQPASSVDVDRLIAQFTELESRSVELRQALTEQNKVNTRLIDRQFEELSSMLLPAAKSARPVSEQVQVRSTR